MKKKSPGSSVPKSVKKKSQDRDILKRKSVALLAKTTKKKKVAPVVDPVEKPDVVMEAAPSVSRQSKGGILAAEYMVSNFCGVGSLHGESIAFSYSFWGFQILGWFLAINSLPFFSLACRLH